MKLEWKNLDETKVYKEWQRPSPPAERRVPLTPSRIRGWMIPAGGGVDFYYGASLLQQEDLPRLCSLAQEQGLAEKYRALREGEVMNTGENRRVLHHLTRGPGGKEVREEGVNVRDFYEEQRQRIADFARKVHAGEILGSTGKPFRTVVQIGIGGSDLGPRAVYLALKDEKKPKMEARFISNVDPDDAAGVLGDLDLETALFILVSKSGTTQETLANRDLVTARMKAQGGIDPSGHFIAVTSKTSPLAAAPGEAFFMDDSIGGRYSSTSAVGGALLSLALGPEVFAEFLEGAFEADKQAREPDPLKNAAMWDALLGVFYQNFWGWGSSAVLPYSQALLRFPAHLQQLDMESNGKSVNRRGEPLPYTAGPVIFGEPGTNGQHSFYQLLHQGRSIVPLQFIGFRQSQTEGASAGQRKLNANLAAQITAFYQGQRNQDPNKTFEGARPSSLLLADRLTPRVMGALLAHYENKVMFQGFCWNVNSFDQEGVQLGKALASAILSGKADNPALETYGELLGL